MPTQPRPSDRWPWKPTTGEDDPSQLVPFEEMPESPTPAKRMAYSDADLLVEPNVYRADVGEPPSPVKRLAYGDADMDIQANLYRVERGVQFQRAGTFIAPASQFRSLGTFSKVSTQALAAGGIIDPTSLSGTGSISTNITTGTFTANMSTTAGGVAQMIISWNSIPLRRMDTTNTPILSNRIQVDGLAASTQYFLYPFWTEPGVALGWAQVPGTSVGTPPICFTAKNSLAFQQANLRTRVFVGLLTYTTPAASGSSSPTSGPGGDSVGGGGGAGGGLVFVL